MARPVKGYDENDVFASWRKNFCWTQRAGATSKVKRRARRRERHNARHDAAQQRRTERTTDDEG